MLKREQVYFVRYFKPLPHPLTLYGATSFNRQQTRTKSAPTQQPSHNFTLRSVANFMSRGAKKIEIIKRIKMIKYEMGTSLAFLHCLNGLECVDRICPCKKVLAVLPNQLTLMPSSCICTLYTWQRGNYSFKAQNKVHQQLYIWSGDVAYRSLCQNKNWKRRKQVKWLATMV